MLRSTVSTRRALPRQIPHTAASHHIHRTYSLHPSQSGPPPPSAAKPTDTATLPGAAETGHLDRTQAASATPTPTPQETKSQFTDSSPQEAADEKAARPNIYKLFGRPFAKVFLGAMFTYQALYYLAERMRLSEVKEEREAEMRGLEGQLGEYRRARGGDGGR